jgi:glycogen debranching enzyme
MEPAGAGAIVRKATAAASGAAQSAPFFIPASASLQELRPRTLKHGDTFAVFDHNGDAFAGPDRPEGLFHRDTRHLSHFYLTIDGGPVLLLSSTLCDDNATLTCDLTNPDLFDVEGRVTIRHGLIHLRRSRFLWNGACLERLVVRNFDERVRRIAIEIGFAADFADLFEVRGARRLQRGEQHPPEVGPDSVVLGYTGLDRRRRQTTLRFDPTPTELTGTSALFALEIPPQEARSLFLEIHCNAEKPSGPVHRAFFGRLREARRALRASAARAASIATSNEIFNEAARRSISDLCMLITDKPEGPYPYAGIPWFSTTFGRDAIITALEMLWLDPAIARGVLGHLAATQATSLDPVADAEPGKILHEARQGEMAELGEVPFRRYYGSVDSTPLYVMLAGAYLERTDDIATIGRLWPNIEAALYWIRDYGDRDGDGFVEYGRQTAEGLANQGWKDSHDSIFHATGALASGPIAVVEVQAYVYGAWRAGAAIAARLQHSDRASDYGGRADALRKAFDSSFFDAALGTYVLALDRDKHPCRVRTSNAGHALLTGIAYPERAGAVVETLMGTTSFCGWGIRTLSATEPRYNPMSYHNGSVWPHDNALIAAGFSRYGYRQEAARIFEGQFAASTYIDLRRLPELFCGFPRQRGQAPTFYPVACMPQAWAAAAPLYMLQSCLGLGFDLKHAQVTFDRPSLPTFLDTVGLRNLTVGSGAVDLVLRRSGSHVVVDVPARSTAVRVLTTI